MTLRVLEEVDLTSPGTVIGRHAAWLPAQGIKFPFQHGGRICKYTCPGEATYDLTSLAHEIAILRALGAIGMAPPVGAIVYARTLISEFGGAWRSDPCGAYGYEIADARALPPGRFDIAAMQRLPIDGSPGAWGDVAKPGNVVNGYLVDVRRSGFDMLRWGGVIEELPRYAIDLPALEAQVRRDGQFPAGERPEPYQDFLLGDRWIDGSRRVADRAVQLGFLPQPGESVLDIGCQTGGFLQWAWLHAAPGLGWAAGVDVHEPYLACARDLARAAQQPINYRSLDVATPDGRDRLVEWTQAACPRGLDHLLLLSMEKHVGEPAIWDLVDRLRPRHAYLESNAQREGAWSLRAGVEARGGVYLGDSRDRNPRRLYRITSA